MPETLREVINKFDDLLIQNNLGIQAPMPAQKPKTSVDTNELIKRIDARIAEL